MEEIQEMIKNSRFYDPSSESTRKRRKRHLDDFEYFCKEIKNMETHAKIWSRDTLIDLQKEYISASARVSTGVLQETVKGM